MVVCANLQSKPIFSTILPSSHQSLSIHNRFYAIFQIYKIRNYKIGLFLVKKLFKQEFLSLQTQPVTHKEKQKSNPKANLDLENDLTIGLFYYSKFPITTYLSKIRLIILLYYFPQGYVIGDLKQVIIIPCIALQANSQRDWRSERQSLVCSSLSFENC